MDTHTDHKHTLIWEHTLTHTDTYTHSDTQIDTHTQPNTYIYSHTQKHAHTQKSTDTYIDTHTHDPLLILLESELRTQLMRIIWRIWIGDDTQEEKDHIISNDDYLENSIDSAATESMKWKWEMRQHLFNTSIIDCGDVSWTNSRDTRVHKHHTETNWS